MNSPRPRAALRQTLLAQRRAFTTASEHAAAFAAAQVALSAHLRALLQQLEAECVGIYWAMQGEFDAVAACSSDPTLAALPWALPYAQKAPPQMHYRLWDKGPLSTSDECGIPSPKGALCVPDVLLVPCLGYTPHGYRLGYGGGYFDRYMALHPGLTTVGVAWIGCEISEEAFAPQAHDQPLTLVVTPQGVVN
ncbi:MAG: 5-formyltetrahydrofolate cyclo-ligase [Burkholderiales bacterium]